ncbi:MULTISPECIES: hypothetical protein [Bifidobacterium]|uniref:hypothetical protein n=1 Tax=Bifidobacterium TaxID=1678 RepID=UPI001BDCBF3F|nr:MULTISPECIES: hypothetical protein [Bifidobacterium]MBT1161297.1 hypothetical protein [Bifidobacterium sp. SO1]MBW3078344.1 hypothetical protein [Bifidobacterium simiiventris]
MRCRCCSSPADIATVDLTCDGSDKSLTSGEQSMTDYLYLNDDGRTWTEIDHGNG